MNDLVVFSGSSNQELAKKIAEHLHVRMEPVELTRFADGEIRPFITGDITDMRVIYVASMYPIPSDVVIEWILTIDAIKRKHPKEILAVIPYMPYIRQSKVHREGESRSAEVVARILSETGVKEIITVDLHNDTALSFFSVPVIHLSAVSLLPAVIPVDGDVIVVSPDQGSAPRAKQAALLLKTQLVVLTKTRSLVNGDTVEHMEIHDDVRGKTAIIVDDIISTGTTIVKATMLLKDNGAKKVVVFGVHAVFAGNAKKNLEDAGIDRMIVTDTIPRNTADLPKGTEIVSVTSLLADAVMVQ